jgi:enamine deaminase RidA (YjgF/YER057c/UK114 family)
MNTHLKRSPCNPISSDMPSCETAVEWLNIDLGGLAAAAEVARFQSPGGVREYHLTVRLTGEGNTEQQFDDLVMAYQNALRAVGIDGSSAVFRRFFCSDVANQADLVGGPLHLSRIGQAPLPGSKFALWAWHLCGPTGALEMTTDGATLSCRRGKLTHHWTAGLASTESPHSYQQTRSVLEKQDTWLQSHGMNMADHVVRTWWFVQNIDADYQGLVEARREFFNSHGLTPETHYIASTGIAGAHPNVAARVSLDSYAISGLRPGQVEFLTAPDHLCPTHDYGVTFERATALSYADRKHIFISGTASIDHAGRILHPGDVIGQLDRTLENIEALLASAGANLGDMAAIIVYLRDSADGSIIEAALREKAGMIPYILVHAPVCRPGWLIEVEGIAVIPVNRPDLPAF